MLHCLSGDVKVFRRLPASGRILENDAPMKKRGAGISADTVERLIIMKRTITTLSMLVKKLAFAAVLAALALALVPSAGCEREKEPAGKPRPRGNLLENPGFELGDAGWQWLGWSRVWGPFEITDKMARSGKKSAYLRLDVRAGDTGAKKIRGVMQSIKPDSFPEVASGWYRIENWKRGVDRQYVQFVVIAWEKYKGFPNYQLRYVLDGVDRQPLRIGNAKYTILSSAPEPETGKWVRFELPIREDFSRLWGKVPDNYDKLNFFYEARFEQYPEGSRHIRADVYFDDLYAGDGG